MRAALVLVLVLGGACSAPPRKIPPSPRPVNPELSTALAALGWLPGTYGDKASSETWVAAGGALYGVTLRDAGTFDVAIVDDADGAGPADGVLRFYAMPNGTPPIELRERTRASTESMTQIVFANDAKSIGYMRRGEDFIVETDHAMVPRIVGPTPSAPELEAADRAFSDDTGKRGVDGWVAAFAPNGAMMRKAGRIEGAAIGEGMKDLLAEGVLAWSPLASGKRGELGFTVGKATFTDGKSHEIEWRSSYVTIWARQPSGAWKVLLDVGRAVNE